MAIEEESNPRTLIRAYGEFWNPDLVVWGAPLELLGTDSQGGRVNAWKQRGVYVLYDDYVPVYVGKAYQTSLGRRLKIHTESLRKGSRWDRFSWFGLNRINMHGDPVSRIGASHAKPSELIATLEALLILAVDPRLNARKESLKNAVRVKQSAERRPVSEMDRRMTSIEQKLDSIIGLTSPNGEQSSKGQPRAKKH